MKKSCKNDLNKCFLIRLIISCWKFYLFLNHIHIQKVDCNILSFFADFIFDNLNYITITFFVFF